jgi:predicted MFS family arabinose efflux permease
LGRRSSGEHGTRYDLLCFRVSSTVERQRAFFTDILSSITSSNSAISHPANIVLLTSSLLLFPAFHFWVARQERLQKPALIPPSLWRSKIFTSICLSVFAIWGSFNALEQLLSFYFQYVQLLSPMQASIRFLAEPVSGIVGNVAAGLLVHRVRGDVLVLTTTALSLVSPTIMALASPTTSYWKAAFPAILCLPAAADMLFTVSNLVISDRFPARTQGLAGGVFQTVSQIGKAVGLALSAVVANSITEKSGYSDKASPDALMEGYKAAWWFTFGLSTATLVVGVLGLRKVGKVGLKKD